MSQAHTQDVTATLTVDGLDDELHVIRFSGEEGISQLYRFQLELASSSQTLDFGKVLGARALLTLSRGSQGRLVSGVVGAFRQDDGTNRFALYELTLVPEAWRLTHRRGCRIFQDADALSIVQGLLGDAHLSCDIRPKGGRRPPAREYCVQYREADWSFISRLLEEEGYYYFFSHQPTRQVLTISNDPQLNRSVAANNEVVYAPGDAMPGEEHVFGVSVSEQVQTGRVTLDDYNFLKPSLDLACSHEADGPDANLEEYDFPGGYSQRERGRALAEVRLQQHRVERQVMEGHGDCTRFAAGSAFTLALHPREDFNTDYVLCAVQHRGESEADLEAGAISPEVSYSNSFSCIRREVPFRPPRLTARPRIHGAQTATVVGPSGEEVHTDAHGRVMVRFHWDRSGSADDRASCWIRVGQLWAGNGWGGLFLPRVGQEVIVSFLEGDPDQPMITGSVYNALNAAPYLLPEQKTISTIRSRSSVGGDGFNEIRFEDNKGKEQLYTRAQRDRLEEVGNDQSTTVGQDQALEVGRNRTRQVTGNETVAIQGDRSLEVAGAATLVTKGDVKVVTRGDKSEQIDGTRTLSARKIILQAQDSIELRCGGASVSLDSLGNVQIKGTAPVSMEGPLVKINAAATGRPAARLGDPSTPTAVVAGSPTVLIGEAPSLPALAAPVGGAVKDAELSEQTGEDVHLPKQPDLVRQALDAARKEITRRVGELQNEVGVTDVTKALELGREAVTSAQGSVTSARGAYDDVMAASGHASSAVEDGTAAVKHLGQLAGHLGAMADDVRSGRLDTVADHFNKALSEGKEAVKDVAAAADDVASGLDKMADAAEKGAKTVEGVRDAADKIFKSVSSLGAGAGKLGGFFKRAASWGEQFGLLRPGAATHLTRIGEGVEKVGKALSRTGSEGSRRLEAAKKVTDAIRGAGSEVRSAGKEVRGWGKQLQSVVAAPAESSSSDSKPEALVAHVEEEQAELTEARGNMAAASEQSHEAAEALRHPSASLGWRNSAESQEELDMDARHAAPRVQRMLSEVCLETGSQATLSGPAGDSPPALPPAEVVNAPGGQQLPADAMARAASAADSASDAGTVVIPADEILEQASGGAGQAGSGPLLGVLLPNEEASSAEQAGAAPVDGTTVMSIEEAIGDAADQGEGAEDSAKTTMLSTEAVAEGLADQGAAAPGAGARETTMLPAEEPTQVPMSADPESVAYSSAGHDAFDLAGVLPADSARSDGAVQSTVTIDHPEQVQPAVKALVERARASGGEAVFDNSYHRPDPRGYGDIHGTLLLPTEGEGYVMSRVRLLFRTYHDTTDQSLLARSARVSAVKPEGDPGINTRKQEASLLMALLAHMQVGGTDSPNVRAGATGNQGWRRK